MGCGASVNASSSDAKKSEKKKSHIIPPFKREKKPKTEQTPQEPPAPQKVKPAGKVLRGVPPRSVANADPEMSVSINSISFNDSLINFVNLFDHKDENDTAGENRSASSFENYDLDDYSVGDTDPSKAVEVEKLREKQRNNISGSILISNSTLKDRKSSQNLSASRSKRLVQFKNTQ
ncbi:hypothetical protein ADEAN_000109200 [Angomonas deanei]|uniref:Uncharacterized protein n=1 Tax=Angomonas deanei TaxID=59799 RepID=A0A7G2C1V6_9TRYP|nr:hypothetical protein ADEAN_000109200 [Angomonas deanei]